MRDFAELEEILYNNSDDRIIPGLERISKLLERLGNPQNSFKSIHIVGTNGKGSTGSFISSVLRASGYRTCFYSSPHLESPAERLLINGEPLDADEWIGAAEAAVKVLDDLRPSYFELLTAAAFLLAREKGTEAGVIEAGLGGKLDATNTMKNTVCSVIASISVDHTEYLGNTLESIASEKFDVVRKNVPAVFSGEDASLTGMFREVCREKGAIPVIVSGQSELRNVRISPEGNEFDFYSEKLVIKDVKTSLTGTYQIKNARLALSALSLMRGEFPKISEASVRKGMLKAKWPGRLEIISRKPLIILDGGHNPGGVKNLCASVKELWPEKKFAVIYAAMRDKDFGLCLGIMNGALRPKLYATKVPGMARAAEPEEILRSAEKFDWPNNPEGFENPNDAVRKALDDGNEAILICGSLYLIGWLKKNAPRD
ncbi:MAG: bifunctional folylpolyglutamate synthase/dihydrofolate synthase [Synergistaceae bacterium]|nr:bifunctional folylpolyglutamate synthase/dihydrofolate synthase [Synergistaceae bacterium]